MTRPVTSRLKVSAGWFDGEKPIDETEKTDVDVSFEIEAYASEAAPTVVITCITREAEPLRGTYDDQRLR